MENNNANGKSILDIQSGSAIGKIMTIKPLHQLFTKLICMGCSSPIKHNHADSFIGITLLETNGDYFDLYWDNDASEFFKNRKIFLLMHNLMKLKGLKLIKMTPEF